MRDSRSELERQSLNARLLRFRAQPESEDPYALADDLLAHDRFADARTVARGAQRPDREEDGALLLIEGRSFMGERDLVRAQAVLQRAVRAAPDLQPVYRYLGEVLLKRGDPQRAVKTLQRALQLDPQDAEAATLAARSEYLSEAAFGSLEALPSLEEASVRAAPGSDLRETRQGIKPGAPRIQPPAPLRQPPPAAPARQPEPPTPTVVARKLPTPYMAKPTEQTRPTRSRKRRDDESTAAFQQRERDEVAAEFDEIQTSPQPPLKREAPRAPAAVRPSAHAALPPLPEIPRHLPPVESRASRKASPVTPVPPTQPRVAPSAAPRSTQPRAASASHQPTQQRGGSAQPQLHSSGATGLPLSALAGAGASSRTFDPPPSAAASARAQAAPSVPSHQVRAEPVRAEPSAATIELSEAHATITSEPPPPSAAAHPIYNGVDVQAPVDAEHVLQIVKSLGLFEHAHAAPANWVPAPGEIKTSGQSLRNTLIGAWILVLLLSAGGYYGFRYYVEQRHAEAAAWVAQANALAQRADHGALVDAERLLRLARERHPASVDVPREALLLQMQRVLDDGERDMAALRTAQLRAQAAHVTGPSLLLAQALLAAAANDPAGRDTALAAALAGVAGDARSLYLLGRIEQRIGKPEGLDHLQAAAKADPKLVPAQLALAEFAYDSDDRASAQRLAAAALAVDAQHLRAQLLKLFFSADDTEPKELSGALEALKPALPKAGNIDRTLIALVRARAARRVGDSETAIQAVTDAGSAGADSAAVLSWVAREALAVGNLTLAQSMASQALIAAPEAVHTRRLLARILIERHDGEHALQLLEKLPPSDTQAQILRAQAALLSNDPEVLKRALSELTELSASKRELGTRIAALRVRIEARQSPGAANLARAKSVARAAPGDPEALLALSEAAIAARDPGAAQNALKQLLAVTPDDANVHCMLGRARRMSGDAPGAEASFKRALELSGTHVEAMAALAGLWLDEGEYPQADALYQQLAMSAGNAMGGRLGRVEALIGLQRLDAAQVQLDAVPDAQRVAPGYREVAAKLALARGDAGNALSQLRPLLEEQADRAGLQALYGDALQAAQQPEAAATAYSAALAQDSELPEALLGSAELLLVPTKVKAAFELLHRAETALRGRIRPPALRARRLYLLGRAYDVRNKRGDDDAAREALLEAVKLPGVPNDAFFFLAEALGGKGHAEARAAYQRYLELEPRGRYRDRARRAL